MPKTIIRTKTSKNPFELIKTYFKTKKVLNKLKSLILSRSCFEEESLLYTYKGEDKDDIWAVMEFFYTLLWKKETNKFCYTDPSDYWENYNFYVYYLGKYSLISILYGIGSTCIIKPVALKEIKTTKRIIDLNKIKYNIFGEIYINDRTL